MKTYPDAPHHKPIPPSSGSTRSWSDGDPSCFGRCGLWSHALEGSGWVRSCAVALVLAGSFGTLLNHTGLGADAGAIHAIPQQRVE